MKRVHVVLLAALFLIGKPAPAHAWFFLDWGYLEHLSGPGPFTGRGGGFDIFCSKPGEGKNVDLLWKCGAPKYAGRSAWHGLSLNIWRGGSDGENFPDAPADTRDLHALSVEPIYFYHLNGMFTVGAGVGMLRLTGDELGSGSASFGRFSTTRLELIPLQVSWTPFGLMRDPRWRVFRVDFEEKHLPGALVGRDFGNTQTKFSSDHETIRRIALVFDFSGVLSGR